MERTLTQKQIKAAEKYSAYKRRKKLLDAATDIKIIKLWIPVITIILLLILAIYFVIQGDINFGLQILFYLFDRFYR